MAKMVPAYMADKGDTLYKLRSSALRADLEYLATDITRTVVGDSNEYCDEFQRFRKGLMAFVGKGISPRSLQRKYARLYRKAQLLVQVMEEEKSLSEDLPF